MEYKSIFNHCGNENIDPGVVTTFERYWEASKATIVISRPIYLHPASTYGTASSRKEVRMVTGYVQ
jgi:hypothetical protein